jgi:hypothetical protein
MAPGINSIPKIPGSFVEVTSKWTCEPWVWHRLESNMTRKRVVLEVDVQSHAYFQAVDRVLL